MIADILEKERVDEDLSKFEAIYDYDFNNSNDLMAYGLLISAV